MTLRPYVVGTFDCALFVMLVRVFVIVVGSSSRRLLALNAMHVRAAFTDVLTRVYYECFQSHIENRN